MNKMKFLIRHLHVVEKVTYLLACNATTHSDELSPTALATNINLVSNTHNYTIDE
jgi:hypothetical protein